MLLRANDGLVSELAAAMVPHGHVECFKQKARRLALEAEGTPAPNAKCLMADEGRLIFHASCSMHYVYSCLMLGDQCLAFRIVIDA